MSLLSEQGRRIQAEVFPLVYRLRRRVALGVLQSHGVSTAGVCADGAGGGAYHRSQHPGHALLLLLWADDL